MCSFPFNNCLIVAFISELEIIYFPRIVSPLENCMPEAKLFLVRIFSTLVLVLKVPPLSINA